jgi:hypothetical protein
VKALNQIDKSRTQSVKARIHFFENVRQPFVFKIIS